MVNGSDELRVVEKNKGFSGFPILGSRCVAWLVSMVKEVLRNIVSEDFVKSYREVSKVTIIRRCGNRFGRFLEVAVYAVVGRRGMTLFPKGWDGRGWSHGGGSVFWWHSGGEILGKAMGPLSFVEVVCSPSTIPALGGRPLV